YVDVHRPFVVWNVEAAPEFSLEPKSWWYPLLGRLDYRGYFSKKAAQKYSDWLTRKGYDVFMGGVEAYSTLGWFKDPVLNTFIFEPEPEINVFNTGSSVEYVYFRARAGFGRNSFP